MENIKVEEINFTNHIQKCRICFKSFGADEYRIQITKVVGGKFKAITQTEVRVKVKKTIKMF